MPNKTKMLDYGGFVHSPETPPSADFAEYLRQIDLLVAARQAATEGPAEEVALRAEIEPPVLTAPGGPGEPEEPQAAPAAQQENPHV